MDVRTFSLLKYVDKTPLSTLGNHSIHCVAKATDRTDSDASNSLEVTTFEIEGDDSEIQKFVVPVNFTWDGLTNEDVWHNPHVDNPFSVVTIYDQSTSARAPLVTFSTGGTYVVVIDNISDVIEGKRYQAATYNGKQLVTPVIYQNALYVDIKKDNQVESYDLYADSAKVATVTSTDLTDYTIAN